MELSCSGYSVAPGSSPLSETLVEEGSEFKIEPNGFDVEVCLEMGCEADDFSSTTVEFFPDVKHSTCGLLSDFDFPTSSEDCGGLQPQKDQSCLNETDNLPDVRLVCKQCGTGCLGLVELERHVKHHKQSNGYGCQICKMDFQKSFQLMHHMKQHVKNWFVCSECGCIFRTCTSLAEHAAEHPIVGESAGDIFKEKQRSAEKFEAHIRSSDDEVRSDDASISIVEDPTSQSCEGDSALAGRCCSSPLVANSEDVLTVPDCHSSGVEVMPLAVPGSHSCLICSQVFTSHETLFNHCMYHPLIHIAGFGLPSCGICNTVFPNVVELHQHVQEKAGILQVIRSASIAANGSSDLNFPSSIILDALKNAIVIEPQCHNGYTNVFQSVALVTSAGDAIETDVKVECSSIETTTDSTETIPKVMIRKEKTRKSDDASYICSQCFRPFLNVQGLLCHMKMHLEGKPYKCNDCGDSFRFPKRLSIHARVFHDVILCIKCGLGEEQCSCVAQKTDDGSGTANFKDSKKPFSCLRCNRVFARVKALHKHELLHIQGIVHVCDICGKRFQDRSQFSRHLALHNGAQHQCQTCEKVFSSDVILRDHMKTHSTERPLTCNICGKDFKWRNALRVHLKKHYGSMYQCYLCGRDFTTKSYLMTHVEMHTGPRVRSHKCNLCDKAYYDKSALRKHRATHAVVRSRPYACTLCGKTFLANNNLQTHLKLHQNERPYKCDVCGKSFNMKGHLKRHMTIHSKTMNILQNDQALFEADGICEETCEEEVVIDSIVSLV